jgi:hypothetical protein
MCAAATGANAGGSNDKESKSNVESEENKWLHYNEFVFIRT